MSGGTTEEGSLMLPDGTSIYKKSWKPTGKPKAIIAYYHGYSDHSNAFFEFFPTLASSGFELHSVDQRGWGRSALPDRKLRGDFGSTSTVMADLHFFLQSLVPLTQEGSTPLFLMGHSMGGMNTLYYILNPESPYHNQKTASTAAASQVKLRGILPIAPLIAIHPSTQPLKIVEYAGRIAQKILPKMTMTQKLVPGFVSSNPVVVEDIINDHGVLFHNTGTLEGLGGMLDRGAWLDGLHKENKNQIVSTKDLPALWVGHGTEDKITWFDASKRLVETLDCIDDRTFKEYKGAYHKLMIEPDGMGEEMTKDVTQWIEARISKDDA